MMRQSPPCGLFPMAMIVCAGLLPAVAGAAGAAVPAPPDLASLPAVAAPVVQTTRTTPATPAPPETTPSTWRFPEPAVERLVSEDDNVRIEELRVRGQTKSITVHNKTAGGSRYEIIPSDGGRDPSQDKRATGQRVWQMFSF